MFDFVHVGSFQRMQHSSSSAGHAALANLPQRPGTWGVGATAGLRGEIVQMDGRLLVSPGTDGQGRLQAPGADEQAGGQGSGHGHANAGAGMRAFHAQGATGQGVGIYSGVALEGVVSHPGERFHLHFVDATATVSGHVDAYAVAAGSVVKLPQP